METKVNKGRMCCIFSAIIIFGAYIMQRVINLVMTPTQNLVLIEAIVFTALTAIVLLLLVKSKDCFYGILIAIFGIRMMPPDISYLDYFSPDANIIYFVMKKAAAVFFIITIIRLYEQQKKPRLIKPIPIISTIIVVPFITEMQNVVGPYISNKTGSMLGSYMLNFALYSLAMITLLFIASRTSKLSAQLICDFQIVALGLNGARRILAIIITTMIYQNHISRSYYCWIAIYVFFIIAFSIMKKRRKTNTI